MRHLLGPDGSCHHCVVVVIVVVGIAAAAAAVVHRGDGDDDADRLCLKSLWERLIVVFIIEIGIR